MAAGAKCVSYAGSLHLQPSAAGFVDVGKRLPQPGSTPGRRKSFGRCTPLGVLCDTARLAGFAAASLALCSAAALGGWVTLGEQHGAGEALMSTQAAVVLGASGSVGNALIKELIQNGSFNPIISLVRRSLPDQVALASAAGIELRETLVPTMDPASLEAATAEVVRALPGDVVGLSVLGIGAGTAKLTIDQHRAIDVQLNAAFARGLKASGRVKHLAFMSAVGADPSAAATGSGAAGMPRYARVKGESEEAVKDSGSGVVSIFRPAMIIGSQHTPWLLEKVLPAFSFVTPAKFKSITVEQIAKAMTATSQHPPTKSDIYHYPEMIALNR
jgi:uncharacterized protein YbjT (DUF2867 family)